ncbi:hypothetical protein [Arsenicibacter rosenii]|uniref:Uncharacterized protein n=1 Tax=Arsenicibacter rosenii TaxID=1750698 RepID=A0A1S2VM18_9BACT|nr:hypothetical protein [Arsenicibacter rosenii]OIN59827.1 hypothetical protein BLX24_08185 [Arsenicibacter rosenii]
MILLEFFTLSDNFWTFLTAVLGAGNVLQLITFFFTRRKLNIETKRDLYTLVDELKLKHIEDTTRADTRYNLLQQRVYDLEKEKLILQMTLMKNGIEVPVYAPPKEEQPPNP